MEKSLEALAPEVNQRVSNDSVTVNTHVHTGSTSPQGNSTGGRPLTY